MVSTYLPISHSSSFLSKPLRTVPITPITIGITVTLMFNSFLSYLVRSKYLSIFSFSLIFTLWSTGTIRLVIFLFSFFFFFVNYLQIWSSGWDQVICLFYKIPENLMHLIFQDGLFYYPHYYYYFTHYRVFHSSVGRWSFTGV